MKDSNHFFSKANFSGGNRQNKKDKEPCRRFNKGKCTFGLACKFDHHCSVKKCGKFRHGAHICRLRASETNDKLSDDRDQESMDKK